MRSSKSKTKLAPKLQFTWDFEAIGTKWWIGVFDKNRTYDTGQLQNAVSERIAEFDATYSRFRSDSLVTSIAAASGVYQFPTDAAALFAWYRQLYDASDGRVTPLIGSVLSDAGYDATYSLRPGNITTPPAWDKVMSWDAVRLQLTVEQPILLDFGAAGKGYLVDIITELLRAHGVKSCLVDAGGDMRATSLGRPELVGLADPNNGSQVIGTAPLEHGAFCASSAAARDWGKYHHIINPQTLTSPRAVSAVWVQADSAMIADGLTTLYYIGGQTAAMPSHEYAVLYDNARLMRSPGFSATIFTGESHA